MENVKGEKMTTFVLKMVDDNYYHNIDSSPIKKTVNHVFSGKDLHLEDVLGEIEIFLKASGFSFSGHLEIIED